MATRMLPFGRYQLFVLQAEVLGQLTMHAVQLVARQLYPLQGVLCCQGSQNSLAPPEAANDYNTLRHGHLYPQELE